MDIAFLFGGVPAQEYTVAALFGRPQGGFRARTAYPSGIGAPVAVHTGDFDLDGHLDLLAVNRRSGKGNLGLLRGTGGGTFLPAEITQMDLYPSFGDVADFNEDGHLDVAVVGNSTDVSVFFGGPGATFATPSLFDIGHFAYRVTAADANSDGHADLLITVSGSPHKSPSARLSPSRSFAFDAMIRPFGRCIAKSKLVPVTKGPS